MKKTAMLLALILSLFFLWKTLFPPVIGGVTGAEWETITIGAVSYTLDSEAPFSSKDRGRFLGIAKGGEDVTFLIFSVNGTEESIYRLWDWEGAFYKQA